jgi:hypothetical protein
VEARNHALDGSRERILEADAENRALVRGDERAGISRGGDRRTGGFRVGPDEPARPELHAAEPARHDAASLDQPGVLERAQDRPTGRPARLSGVEARLLDPPGAPHPIGGAMVGRVAARIGARR